jgi:anti-sigma regulatory factor (Ser/Thr protein kinase)
VGRARRFVVDQLKALGVSDPNAGADLVVSELVTNAVMHAGTPITVRVERVGRAAARIDVFDGSQVLPGLRSVSLHDASGRGLTIVEHFANSWGAERTESGKVVWFVVGDAAKVAG